MAKRRVRNFDSWLKEYLKVRRNISEEEVNELERLSKEENVPFHYNVIKNGIIKIKDAYKMAETVLSFKVSHIPSDYKIDKGYRLMSKRLIERHQVLPLEVDRANKTITLLTSNPTNLIALDEIRKDTKLKPIPIFVLHQEIKETFERENSNLSDLMEEMSDSSIDILQENEEAETEEESTEEEPIIVRIVNSILSDAIQSDASDIHIEPLEDTIRIRFRIDGILIPKVNNLDKRLLPSIISRIKVLGSMDISETRRPQDGRFRSKTSDGREVDFRASTLFTQYGEKAVLRLTQRENHNPDINSIDLTEDDKELIMKLTKSPYGLLLTTGPTGSGKTTTLYGILGYLNTSEKNIVTIEEPIERQLYGVNQTSVNQKAGITFSSGLKTILRQDPDILMVGEIRDSETAETTIQAALTGHLVLSTLHTNDSAGAITRLRDMGVDDYKIPSAVLGVVAQRLIRKNCDNCTVDYTPNQDELAIIRSLSPDSEIPEDIKLKKGKGCNECNDTGYKGRMAIFEILIMDDEMKEFILDGNNTSQIKRKAIENGMKTMERRGVEEIIKGVTTTEELQRVIFI